MTKSKILLYLESLALCLSAGIIGGLFTTSAITEWYQYINKPSFNPPNWIFGPVWTLLYFMMSIALYLVWQKGLKKKENWSAFIFFMVQLGLNTLWSILFFGLRSPLLGLIDIALLFITIVVVIYKFFRINKTASLMLAPYLLWVTFASVLNFFIWKLN